MVLCTVIYNASSGSDTAASGSNAPTTAHTDTTLSQTVSTATSTTQTFSGTIDLTGVANDGTDVIWINTASGQRHLFRITSFTGGVSTCTAVVTATAAGGTAGGLSWAIGGIRKTLINDTARRDLADALSGWRLEFQAGTYASGSASLSLGTATNETDGPIEMVAASGASPAFTWTSDSWWLLLSANNIHTIFRGLTITNTTSTNTGAHGIYLNSQAASLIQDCTIACSGYAIYARTGQGLIQGCDLKSTHAAALQIETTGYTALRCIVHDSVVGITAGGVADNTQTNQIIGCVVRDNTTGIDVTTFGYNRTVVIMNSVIEANGDGVKVTGTVTVTARSQMRVVNNIFTNNTGYGLNFVTSQLEYRFVHFNNAYYNNTSGARNNLAAGDNDVTLTADPYTAVGSDDYTLNDTAGGGAACKDVGYGYNG